METRKCKLCGAPFKPVPKGHTRLYCSTQCTEEAQRQRRQERDFNPCPNCGQPKHKTAKYCKKCFGIFMKGESNPFWKGGRTLSKQGYIIVHTGKSRPHPRYIREHRLIWEQTHGKPIPKGWIIHHLNGIKQDNRPRNLIAMPTKRHSLLVPALEKRIQELEAFLNGQGHLV